MHVALWNFQGKKLFRTNQRCRKLWDGAEICRHGPAPHVVWILVDESSCIVSDCFWCISVKSNIVKRDHSGWIQLLCALFICFEHDFPFKFWHWAASDTALEILQWWLTDRAISARAFQSKAALEEQATIPSTLEKRRVVFPPGSVNYSFLERVDNSDGQRNQGRLASVASWSVFHAVRCTFPSCWTTANSDLTKNFKSRRSGSWRWDVHSSAFYCHPKFILHELIKCNHLPVVCTQRNRFTRG